MRVNVISVPNWTGPATNTAIRATTIAIRAALLVGLGVWLQPSEVGLFGLIGAAVTISTYLYGLDFYTFAIRELSGAELNEVRYRLRDQFVLFGAIYLVGGIVLAGLLPRFGLEPGLALLVAAIAMFQHSALELYRVLLRLQQTLSASLSFFIRDAAWVPACLVAWWLTGDLAISDVLLFWLVGSVAANGLAAWLVFCATPTGKPRPIDSAWLRSGIRTGLRMLPGTLSLRGLFTVDRLILALLVPPDAVGAYVFYGSLCMAAMGLFETGIMPYFWPRLLEAVRNGNRHQQAAAERALARACFVGAPALAVITVAAGVVLAGLLPNPIYAAHLEFLLWISAACMFVTLSNIPHYRLYAGRRDLAIVGSNAAAFLIFLALSGALGLAGLRLAVPVGLVAASIMLLALKWAAARRHGV